ncbi:hypothetical protein RZN25_03555 [Bacillaceae bacterium S4-13-56]
MYVASITLISISIVLFIVSLFMKNRFNQIDEQIEQLSLSMMQENYQLKKKLKILEEELLVTDDSPLSFSIPEQKGKSFQNVPLLVEVQRLSKAGKSPETIAKQTSLSIYDVRSILQQIQNSETGGTFS